MMIRMYIADAHKQFSAYGKLYAAWSVKHVDATNELAALTVRLKLAASRKPAAPSISAIEALVQAEAADIEREKRLAADEEQRQLKKMRTKEAERLARLEHNVDGLVLLKKSIRVVKNSFGGDKITGMIENRRPRTISLAHIEFNVYDRSDSRIGSATDSISNLEPGGKWRFEAIVFEDNYYSYVLSELSSY